MEKLIKLKEAFSKAKDDYESFMSEVSRELTDEEKEEYSNSSTPTFLNCETSEPKMIELTIESAEKMQELESNIRNTQKEYFDEYKKNHLDIK